MRGKARAIEDRSGAGTVFACVLVMLATLLLTVTFLFCGVLGTVNGAKSRMQEALDAVLGNALSQQYDTVRDGNLPTVTVGLAEVSGELARSLAIAPEGGSFTKRRGDDILWSLRLTDVTETRSEDLLTVAVQGELRIPVVFGGETVGTVTVPIRVESGIGSKYERIGE